MERSNQNPFVKICGITNLDDAMMAIKFGADGLGFVFAPSKRRIQPENAREIIKVLPPFITTFGVFMDQTVKNLEELVVRVGVDVVQLHGSETPEDCLQVTKRVVKRIPVTFKDTQETLINQMKLFRVSAFLLDPGAGEGRVFNWDKGRNIPFPLIVAGGLKPDNVRKAVQILKPYGVDVSSGVEKTPGRKDPDKVKRFIEEAKC